MSIQDDRKTAKQYERNLTVCVHIGMAELRTKQLQWLAPSNQVDYLNTLTTDDIEPQSHAEDNTNIRHSGSVKDYMQIKMVT